MASCLPRKRLSPDKGASVSVALKSLSEPPAGRIRRFYPVHVHHYIHMLLRRNYTLA